VKQAHDDFEHGYLVGRAVVMPEAAAAIPLSHMLKMWPSSFPPRADSKRWVAAARVAAVPLLHRHDARIASLRQPATGVRKKVAFPPDD
jgi:hypothetical protein